MPGKPHSAAWVDINGDTYLDLYIGAFEACNVGCYQSDQIWLNNTNGTFSRQTSFVAPTSPAYGVTTADWDRDGDMDIYVANYRLEPNFLWQNNGQGGLTRAGNAHFGHSMGAAFGDFDNNGEFDLFAGNFSHSGQPQSRFLMNMGPGSACGPASPCFNDIGQRGITRVESYSTPTFGDLDNDGDLDLYFASVYQEPSRLWRNMFIETSQLNFTDISSTWNIISIVGNKQTTFGAFGDYNNDGLLDLSTANLVLENDGTHNGASFANRHWLKVKLDGDGKFDATAIGSQVRIDVPGLGTLTCQVEGAVGTHGNQNDHTLHFGLGSHDGPLSLDVTWPDGTSRTFDVSGVDQTITIKPGPPPDAPRVVVFLSTSDEDPELDNPTLDLQPGQSGSLYVWVKPDQDQLVSVGLDVVSSEPGVVQATAHEIFDPYLALADKDRWDFTASGDLGELVTDSSAVAHSQGLGLSEGLAGLNPPLYDQTTGTFLHSRIDFDAVGTGDAEIFLKVGDSRLRWSLTEEIEGWAQLGLRDSPVFAHSAGDVSGLADALISVKLFGDMDGNAVINDLDIDKLRLDIFLQTTDSSQDLNNDSVVNNSDVHYLITEVLATSIADVNLDGMVDGRDLATIRANMGENVTTQFLPWSQGNIVPDGIIDQIDLIVLRNHFGYSNPSGSAPSQSIPESATLTLLVPIAAVLARKSH